jgi:CHAT domain-containing protein/tetratricopeptide (TPR) repeat protein
LREFEQHLSPDLFHRLVEAGETGQRTPELDSAAQHAAACAVCRQELEQYQRVQHGLKSMRLDASEEAMRTPECPPESEWASLAAGLLEEKEAAARVDHAARCSYCGSLLREAMEDLSEELSDDECRLLRQLPSAKEENQQRLAARLASTGAAAGRRLASRRLWTWGFAVAAVLALLAVLVVQRIGSGPTAAEKLLAQAYTANRDLELRIPGAEYSPMATVRGANASQPLPLLRAEVLIDRQLAAHPDSVAWIALQGRAQLLQGNFEQARSTFQQALRLDPRSPSILTDLATAEYALSEQEGRSEQSMAAAEHLSEALKLRPNDPVALYNRALVFESIGSLPLALKDWERYLRIDPSSAWATKVAREHLERLKKHLSSSPQSELPPSDPSAAAAWLANRLKQPLPPAGTMDSADEQLLDVAVTRWLPDAYAASGAPAPEQEAERTALDRLAEELIRRHGDHWLKDVLTFPGSPALSAGLKALSHAIRLNIGGRPDEAERQAASAAKLLTTARSPAALRAETELAYAYQRETSNSDRCALAVRSTLRELGQRPYRWIEAQLLLERATCDFSLWRLGQSRQSIVEAVEVSRSSGYGVLYLRGVGFLAAFATAVGEYRQAWQGDRTGLEAYWDGSYPPMRAYQFYADMTFGPEAAGDWPLAEGLAREGVEMIARTPNKAMEALARFRFATVADLAGDRETANDEFQKAARIFAGLPPDPAFEVYREDSQIYLANIEVQTGRPDLALGRLLRMQSAVQRANDAAFVPRYFRALGEAYLAEGDVGDAEDANMKAVAIAERGLYTLKSGPERVSWVGWYADVYRSFVRAELKGRNNPMAALGVWEWYRSGPVRSQESAADAASRLLPSASISPAESDSADLSNFRIDLENWIRREQARLRRESVVSYAQFSDGIEIWVFDDRGITSRWVAVRQREFDRVSRRFGQECADPTSSLDVLKSDGRQLYQWLIAPVASRLVPSRILAFETDGAIAWIPLQALVDERGAYLGDRFAVLLSPGLGYKSALSPAGKFSASDRLLAIGAPAISSEWQSMFLPLPDADVETQAVAANFRRAIVLTGNQAILGTVLDDLRQAQILHFAGHALAEGMRTGLVLAGDENPDRGQGKGASLLSASDLTARELRACRLAVLSACSTAGGEGAALVDPKSLVGAFLLAGVPHVVASRWNVNSAATATLMGAFYRRLLAGDSVPHALQNAAETVQRSPETSHPFFWAAFSAYGR